jgi:hypothetical protein
MTPTQKCRHGIFDDIYDNAWSYTQHTTEPTDISCQSVAMWVPLTGSIVACPGLTVISCACVFEKQRLRELGRLLPNSSSVFTSCFDKVRPHAAYLRRLAMSAATPPNTRFRARGPSHSALALGSTWSALRSCVTKINATFRSFDPGNLFIRNP